MLTKDLLRFKVQDGKLVPGLLKPTPATLELAQRLIDYWRQGVGRRRGELDEGAMPILHQSRALLVGKGLQKVILDGCRFSDPASTEHLRSEALLISASLLARPAPDADRHRALVAERLGTSEELLAERLYGDLPHAAVLEAAPGAIAPRALLDAYNLGLCQGLLLHARELRVVIHDADTGMRRRLLKALRFRRLLATVGNDRDEALELVISGPGSVLDQANRYGLQLALFLPALACARRWQASAAIAVPRGAHHGASGGLDRSAILELSDALGLPGDSAFLGHVPEELRDLHATLATRFPAWRFADPQLLPLPGGELVVPDLQVEVDGRVLAVELFHRWHGHALRRRLDQLARGLAPHLAIGVDRALARNPDLAPLLDGAAFRRQGFQFTEIPAPRALGEVVARLLAAG